MQVKSLCGEYRKTIPWLSNNLLQEHSKFSAASYDEDVAWSLSEPKLPVFMASHFNIKFDYMELVLKITSF